MDLFGRPKRTFPFVPESLGEPCELYHCVLESKSFLEKMTVLEHTVPFFLPIRDAENELLSSNAMKFIDHVGELLQAYVDRREQVPRVAVESKKLLEMIVAVELKTLGCCCLFVAVRLVEFPLASIEVEDKTRVQSVESKKLLEMIVAVELKTLGCCCLFVAVRLVEFPLASIEVEDKTRVQSGRFRPSEFRSAYFRPL
ncbi:unnamed protein product [Ilex paraguariensis]|uniref:Centromere protein O n=1 Tax=Ilex paraguariensis TaxID=185542 RepID=A0ABC8QVQ4_9AQUA